MSDITTVILRRDEVGRDRRREIVDEILAGNDPAKCIDKYIEFKRVTELYRAAEARLGRTYSPTPQLRPAYAVA